MAVPVGTGGVHLCVQLLGNGFPGLIMDCEAVQRRPVIAPAQPQAPFQHLLLCTRHPNNKRGLQTSKLQLACEARRGVATHTHFCWGVLKTVPACRTSLYQSEPACRTSQTATAKAETGRKSSVQVKRVRYIGTVIEGPEQGLTPAGLNMAKG